MDESGYRSEIQRVNSWCEENQLQLNVLKTKELVIDFRHRPSCVLPVFIHETPVEIIHKYKYLGVIIDDGLKWSDNINMLYGKGQQRLYF